MEFVSARVITDDIKRLVKFYEDVTGPAPTWYTADFAALATPGSTLPIGSTSTMAMFGTTSPGASRNQFVSDLRVRAVKHIQRYLLAASMSHEQQKLSRCAFLSSHMCLVRVRQRKSLSERNRQLASSDGLGHRD